MTTSEQAPSVEVSHDVVDRRPRWRRMVWPVTTGIVVLAATTYIRFVDPNQPGHYPICPTRFFLGLDCPGCGGLRATHSLANGDVAGAVDHNALFVLAVPAMIVGWAVWMVRAWTGRRPPSTPRSLALSRVLPPIVVGVALAFGIVRNFVPYLGSGVG